VGAEAVARVGREVEVAPAVDLAAPHDRAPADLASADPVEARAVAERVRVLEVVDEELAAPLVAGVALALGGLVPLLPGAVGPAAEMELPGLDVHRVVGGGIGRAAGLEDQRAQAVLGQLLGGPAAADAGADDDGIVGDGHQALPRTGAAPS